MPRTLADLTLTLTRELSALEARCAKEVDQAEKSRDGALMKVRPAQAALKRYHRGVAQAKETQWKAVEKANEIRDKEFRAAEDKRRPALAREERDYRQAKARALRARDEALRKARAKRQTARRRAREHPLSEHRAIRKAADRAFEAAVQKARESYRTSIDKARLAFQSAVQDVLEDERLALEKATRKADRTISNAAVAYERAVAHEEARIRSQVSKHDQARRVQERYDRRLSQILRACDRRKEALFKKFSQDRKRLKR